MVIASTTSNAGAVAALAEERKLALYDNLVPSHYFMPVAFETSGPCGSVFMDQKGYIEKMKEFMDPLFAAGLI